jgi:hypothetical protein
VACTKLALTFLEAGVKYCWCGVYHQLWLDIARVVLSEFRSHSSSMWSAQGNTSGHSCEFELWQLILEDLATDVFGLRTSRSTPLGGPHGLRIVVW